jgi:cytochrome P450
MSIENLDDVDSADGGGCPFSAADDAARKDGKRIDFDRHGSGYREDFQEIAADLHARCPVAWTDNHDGYWVASGNKAVFDIARRADVLSNDHDIEGVRKGYTGISIPSYKNQKMRGGFLEMDPPEQRHYRQALNPYLSPAAVARWQPVIDEVTRACLDEKIESGSIDLVEDLANVVPAVVTLAMMGIPLRDWVHYSEPVHASVYTPPDSPDRPRVLEEMAMVMGRIIQATTECRANPKPGLIDALIKAEIAGGPAPEHEIWGVLSLLIGGGFDTTTALTAHALEWLSEHPQERERLSRERETLLAPATEEFLRYYTPAVGDGRTVSADVEIAGTQFKEGDRLWLSWAMANRDPAVFEHPSEIQLDRKGNRHSSFGLGIHRCIGSNMARAVFKTMLTQVLDRMPDYVCDAEGAAHYETTGVINGMRALPATFTPGTRLGASLEDTLEKMQRICDEQRLAEPVTVRTSKARITD